MIKSSSIDLETNFKFEYDNRNFTSVKLLKNGVFNISGDVKEISQMKYTKNKNNSPFKILNIEDETGQIKVFVWEESLNKINGLLRGDKIRIKNLTINRELIGYVKDKTTLIIDKNIIGSNFRRLNSNICNRYRTKDKHNVLSRAEIIIDNLLYDLGIKHEYEFRLEFSGVILKPDWFLPDYNIIIEFWGMEDKENYLKNENKKLKIYAENRIACLSLNSDDLVDYRKLQQRIINFVISYAK